MSSELPQPPAPLFTAACCAGVGILLGDQAQSPAEWCLVLLPAALVYALCAPWRLSWLCLLLLAFAALHYHHRVHSPSRELARRMPAHETLTAILTGTVDDVPRPAAQAGDKARFQFTLRLEDSDPRALSVRGAEVLIHTGAGSPRCGERLRLRAALRHIPPPRNPGQSDRAGLWNRRGIWVEAFVSQPGDVETLSAPAFWQPPVWAARCRGWISDILARGIEQKPQEHALITSMVLGVRDAGLREAEDWFRQTGTLHLFAVSGLNMSMLAWLLATVFRLGGAGQHLVALVLLPVLTFYACVTGLGPSCLRALVGAVLLLGSTWVERASVARNNIGAAALVLLLADTNTLFNAGFQLSFCLVLVLLQFATPLGRRLGTLFEPDPLLPRKLWSDRQRLWVRTATGASTAVAAGLVSFAGGLPWCFLVFHSVAPIGVVINPLVLPVAFGVLGLGLCGVLCAPFPTPGAWINRSNAFLAEVLLHIVRSGSSIPGGSRSVSNPFEPLPDFAVLDAGNGAAVLLDIRGKPWLLDCGSESQFEAVLRPALRYYGLNSLEGLALSHGDAAHIGGALGACRLFAPRLIAEPAARDRSPTRRRLATALAAAGASPRAVAAGDFLQQAPKPVIEILHPPPTTSASLADDKCLVVRFETGHGSLLYTADSGYPTERWLLEHCPDKLRADVWIRGNHAREATGTDAFVAAVDPVLIVVCGGREPGALQRWSDKWRGRGKTVWLQQETGALEGWIGKRRMVRSFLNRERLEW
jgi:competence protein ComEC